jgi:hypothetical protein
MTESISSNFDSLLKYRTEESICLAVIALNIVNIGLNIRYYYNALNDEILLRLFLYSIGSLFASCMLSIIAIVFSIALIISYENCTRPNKVLDNYEVGDRKNGSVLKIFGVLILSILTWFTPDILAM